jgi:hypothetical protein
LNHIRGEERIPPVQLIDLNVAEARAKYLARTNLFSHYDAEGRHPVYWYTRLDGGLYGVEENLLGRWFGRIVKVNYTDAMHIMVFEKSRLMWGTINSF